MRFRFRTSYEQDVRLIQHEGQAIAYSLLGVVLLAAPWWAGEYVMSQLHFICIYAIVGFGLMMLVGFTGQISLGNAAFLAVGAYTTAALAGRLELPFPVVIPLSGLVAAVAGMFSSRFMCSGSGSPTIL